jgi:hypothetical protein
VPGTDCSPLPVRRVTRDVQNARDAVMRGGQDRPPRRADASACPEVPGRRQPGPTEQGWGGRWLLTSQQSEQPTCRPLRRRGARAPLTNVSRGRLTGALTGAVQSTRRAPQRGRGVIRDPQGPRMHIGADRRGRWSIRRAPAGRRSDAHPPDVDPTRIRRTSIRRASAGRRFDAHPPDVDSTRIRRTSIRRAPAGRRHSGLAGPRPAIRLRPPSDHPTRRPPRGGISGGEL